MRPPDSMDVGDDHWDQNRYEYKETIDNRSDLDKNSQKRLGTLIAMKRSVIGEINENIANFDIDCGCWAFGFYGVCRKTVETRFDVK